MAREFLLKIFIILPILYINSKLRKSLLMRGLFVGKVALDNLVPGMRLSTDLRDRNGRLLLKAGTELSDRCLHLLRTWGTVEAEIEGSDDDSTGAPVEVDPQLLASIEKKIAPLFRGNNPDHPAIRELMRIRIMQEAGHGDC